MCQSIYHQDPVIVGWAYFSVLLLHLSSYFHEDVLICPTHSVNKDLKEVFIKTTNNEEQYTQFAKDLKRSQIKTIINKEMHWRFKEMVKPIVNEEQITLNMQKISPPFPSASPPLPTPKKKKTPSIASYKQISALYY